MFIKHALTCVTSLIPRLREAKPRDTIHFQPSLTFSRDSCWHCLHFPYVFISNHEGGTLSSKSPLFLRSRIPCFLDAFFFFLALVLLHLTLISAPWSLFSHLVLQTFTMYLRAPHTEDTKKERGKGSAPGITENVNWGFYSKNMYSFSLDQIPKLWKLHSANILSSLSHCWHCSALTFTPDPVQRGSWVHVHDQREDGRKDILGHQVDFMVRIMCSLRTGQMWQDWELEDSLIIPKHTHTYSQICTHRHMHMYS